MPAAFTTRRTPRSSYADASIARLFNNATLEDPGERVEREVDVALVVEEVEREARRAEARRDDDGRLVQARGDLLAVAPGVARGDDSAPVGVVARRQHRRAQPVEAVGEPGCEGLVVREHPVDAELEHVAER